MIFMTPNDQVRGVVALESIKFDDEMFPNLRQFAIGPSRYLEMEHTSMHLNSGQIRLRNVHTFHMSNAILHVDSLREVHVESIIMLHIQRPQLDTVFVPALPSGVINLTIQTSEKVRILVYMTLIPDSVISLVLPFETN